MKIEVKAVVTIFFSMFESVIKSNNGVLKLEDKKNFEETIEKIKDKLDKEDKEYTNSCLLIDKSFEDFLASNIPSDNKD